jgi:hypothetical protein
MLMVAFAIYLASGSILRSTAPLVGVVAVAVAVPVMLGARRCIGISEAMGCWCWLNSAEPVAGGLHMAPLSNGEPETFVEVPSFHRCYGLRVIGGTSAQNASSIDSLVGFKFFKAVV